MLEDKELSKKQKNSIVTRSLVGKVDDATNLLRHKTVREVVNFLKSMYGTMSYPDYLKADIYQQFQVEKETVSEYLMELYIDLSEIMSLRGLEMHEFSITGSTSQGIGQKENA